MGVFMSKNEELKKPLKDIQNQLNGIRKELSDARISINETHMAINDANIRMGQIRSDELHSYIRDSKISNFNLYWSIFFSAIVGVMGNWVVTLWFQPPTEDITHGLIISGFALVVTLALLAIQMIKSIRRLKATSNIP
jgi:hypothetical protein